MTAHAVGEKSQLISVVYFSLETIYQDGEHQAQEEEKRCYRCQRIQQ